MLTRGRSLSIGGIVVGGRFYQHTYAMMQNLTKYTPAMMQKTAKYTYAMKHFCIFAL